jgi:hypothetical protein
VGASIMTRALRSYVGVLAHVNEAEDRMDVVTVS